METNISTENLLDSDSSLDPKENGRNFKQKNAYKSNKSDENLLGSDESSSHQDGVHMVRPVKRKESISKDGKLEKSSSGFSTTTSYGVWEKKSPNILKTAAEVHRANEPPLAPVPLPRRKIADEAALISTSPDRVVLSSSPEADGISNMFFSQSRQNTILSQHDDNNLSKASETHSASPKIVPPMPKPRNKIQVSNIIESSSSSSKSNANENKFRDNIELKSLSAISNLRISSPLRTYDKTSLTSIRSQVSGTDDDTSTSEGLSESSQSAQTPASVYTINEKLKSKSKVALPKPARKIRSTTTKSPKNELKSNQCSYEKLIGNLYDYLHNYTYLLIIIFRYIHSRK